MTLGLKKRTKSGDKLLLYAWLTGLACCLLPARVFGLGFLVPNQDATAIGRGNAFAATANNPSAIYYNPAGISQLSGVNLQLGLLNYVGIDGTYSPNSGPGSTTRFQIIPIPQFYATYSPTNFPLSFGLGVYAPFGLGVNWPSDSSISSLAIESKLTYITVNPVVSWQVLKSLSVAVGPTINYARIKFNRNLIWQNDFFQFQGDGYSYGMTAGLLWHPLTQWAFGASYRLAATTDFSGSSTYNNPPPGVPVGTGTVGTTGSLPFPQMASAGISFRPTPKWNVEFDLDYINWSPVQTVTLNGTSALFGSNLPLQLNWHDSWQYKFGVTRYFENGYFVSAGYFFSSDTTSSEYFNPNVPDVNFHVGSIGFGYNGENWSWALAGQIIVGPIRTIDADAGNTNPYTGVSAAGNYTVFSPTVSLSVGYHF